MKFVVVNADDLGIAPSVNDAICQAATDGLLTSASLMPSMPAFEHAIQCVSRRCPELGLGAHLCLTSGRPITPPREIPLLVDAAGRFRHSFGSLWRLCHSAAATDAGTQIRQEWTAQLDRLDAAGIALDHVDSHQHVHAIPPHAQCPRPDDRHSKTHAAATFASAPEATGTSLQSGPRHHAQRPSGICCIAAGGTKSGRWRHRNHHAPRCRCLSHGRDLLQSRRHPLFAFPPARCGTGGPDRWRCCPSL